MIEPYDISYFVQEVVVIDEINGLPAHVLLVHMVILLLPLAALMLIASAAGPAARTKLGFPTPDVAFVAVPARMQAGEWLRDAQDNPLLRRHADRGDSLLPWAIGIFVLATPRLAHTSTLRPKIYDRPLPGCSNANPCCRPTRSHAIYRNAGSVTS